uniref:Polymerase (DNA directed) kappa n=1 Tax=Sinocyclocheilus grahami TaxID=75366 RepID=A0A672KRC1_SINGR
SGQRVQSLFHQNFVSHGLRVLQVPFGKLQASCHLGRVIVHVDMDTFYAAVEMRDCPELKDKLMAVGSMSMLSTSNYHSIRFGKLCPNLFIVLTNFDKYRAVSAQIFSEYDPHFMPMSLDEAYKSTAESEKDELSPVLFEDSPSSSPSLSGAHRKAEVFGTSAEEAVREMTKINGKRSVIHKKKMPLSESSSKASQTTNSLEAVTEISSASKGLSLMCPVCSQPQSTDDLALFNRHVDMCLNQEVLLEFRESHAPVDHSDSALKGVRGQQGSSPLPPSKEIKVLSTKHTIDKFFKDNTRQNI